MYCSKCGKEIDDQTKFCTFCGTQINKLETEVLTTEEIREKPEKKDVLTTLISVVSFFAAFALGKFLGLVVFIFIGAWALGEWFPKWYMKRDTINPRLVNWLVWSNTVTWLLPPLGTFTGFAALRFADSFPLENKKYRLIAVLALFAVLINAAVGVIMKL